jgi:hypothetical protein
MPIERTLHEHIALGCADEASQHVSRDMASIRVKGLADGVGSSSAPLDGYIAFADCASGMSDEQTSIKRSFRLPARSSVGGMSSGFVRRSNWLLMRLRLTCFIWALVELLILGFRFR